jgi:hypothetical protein
MSTLCFLDKNNVKTKLADLPDSAMGMVYAKAIKSVLVCDPAGKCVLKVGKDGKVEEWFRSSELKSPAGICLSVSSATAYIKSPERPFFWQFSVASPSTSMPVLGTVGESGYDLLNKSSPLDHHKPNGLCKMVSGLYWASIDRHRIICAGTDSHISVEYGCGRRGFMLATNPLVSRIDSPGGLCSDQEKLRFFLSDTGNDIIRELGHNMACLSVFGKPGEGRRVDGPSNVARLSRPADISCNGSRVVFTDGGKTIRQIDRLLPERPITTLYETSSELGGVSCANDEIYFVEM